MALPVLIQMQLSPSQSVPASDVEDVVRVHASSESVDSAKRFREIVDAHFAFIWRSLRGLGVPKDSVDDAAQNVFWIASQKLDTITIGSERSFLFSTARGVAANSRRMRVRNREVMSEQVLLEQVDDAPNAEELIEGRDKRALLDRVLEAMQDDLREVFVLFVLEGATASEISEILGIAQGTVASRVRRARESFHENAKRIQSRNEFGGGR